MNRSGLLASRLIRPRRLLWVVVAAVLLALVVGLATSRVTSSGEDVEQMATLPIPVPREPPSRERALAVLGEPRSGGDWLSGIWASGDIATGDRVEAFGDWRGTPVDAITMYPAYATWQQIADSTWHIETFASSPAVLVYGLPMLPSDGSGSFESIVSGEHDAVYRKVARDLVARGRERSIVRIGWEANGDWFSWNTTTNTAAAYRAAFRHIVAVLRSEAPELVIDFDVACGTPLRGQQDRTDALELLYPGDDAVDLVGCDFYDWYHTTSTDEASWQRSLRPRNEVGPADVADFARARGKGLTVPEWGVASREVGGIGDNPFFMTKMRQFFEDNADVMVLESYFSEPDTSLANSIWDPVQQPESSEVYRRLW